MSTLELKSEIHVLVDKTDDDDQLHIVRDILRENSSFDSMTPDEQRELLEAIEESKDPNNRIPHEQVMREAREWLSR